MASTTPLSACERLERLRGELHRLAATSDLKTKTQHLRERFNGIAQEYNDEGLDVEAATADLEKELVPYLEEMLMIEMHRFCRTVKCEE